MNVFRERAVVAVVILSFVVGSISGALSGVFVPALLRSGGGELTPGLVDRVLNTEDAATIAAVKRALPAVVSITITKEQTRSRANPNDAFNDFFGGQTVRTQIGGGSGFIVTENGMIITNKHVVSDRAADYTVVLQDGKQYPAQVLALDPVLDLAVIKIEGQGFPSLELGDSDQITIGETVVAIGNALAEFQNTVTKGIISGVNRHIVAGSGLGTEVIEEAIQTDAAINLGNSGGPLIDLNGRVIGINTAISESAQSLGFALPSNLVKRALESVQKDGRIVRPWIGVRYVQINEDFSKQNGLPSTDGALIVRGDARTDVAVVSGSPADKAGLVENDIILEINDQTLDENHTLSQLLSKNAPGDTLKLKIFHQGKEKEVSLTLEERPEDAR